MKKIIHIVIIITLMLLFVVYGIDSKGSDEVECIVRYDLENGSYKYDDKPIKYSFSVNRNLLKTNDVVIRIYLDNKEFVLRNATSNEFWKKTEYESYHLTSQIISDNGHKEINMSGTFSKNLENLIIFYNDGNKVAFIPTQNDVDSNDVLEYFKEPRW